MINFSDSQLFSIAVHKVGNKSKEEICRFSDSQVEPNIEIRSLLLHYFITPFKTQEYNSFFHDVDLKFNEVYSYISEIFNTPETFLQQSINLCKHLYEKSIHPKIQGGEFYATYFKGCKINDEIVDAIGLFKSENKDTFLKVYQSGGKFEIQSDEGININKLDKGCIIFNINKESGYVVLNVDNKNKGEEAKYWTNDFLHIQPRKDDFYYTQNILSLCKNFVTNELPKEFEVTKADQAILLNKSLNALKNGEQIELKKFAEEVFTQSNIIDSFERYKNQYLEERNLQLEDTFNVSETAVKKKAKGLMTTIRLDKNFEINIHGGEEYLERGYDKEKRLNYYQLFFVNEK